MPGILLLTVRKIIVEFSRSLKATGVSILLITGFIRTHLALFLGFVFLLIFLLLPIIHAAPWWVPLVVFVGGYIADNATTALGAVLWGKEKFSRIEGNASTVRFVQRFGSIGVLFSSFSRGFLFVLGVLCILAATAVTPFFLRGLAREEGFLSIPEVLIGTYWFIAGGFNNTFVLLKNAESPNQ